MKKQLTSEDHINALTNKEFNKKFIELGERCKGLSNKKIDIGPLVNKTKKLSITDKLVMLDMLNKYKPHIENKLKFFCLIDIQEL